MFVGRTEKRELPGRSLRSEDLHLRAARVNMDGQRQFLAALLSHRWTWVHRCQTSIGNAMGS